MRGTTLHHQTDDEEQFSSSKEMEYTSSKKRLDLNDLLKRAKDQKKSDKKANLIIFSAVASVFLLFLLIVSF